MNIDEDLRLFLALTIVVTVGVGVVGGGLFAGGFADQVTVEPVVGEEVTVDDRVDAEPNGLMVSMTTGYAAQFDASNSERYVETNHDESWRDGDWGVALTAELDEEVNENAAYTAYAAENETLLIVWDDGEWFAYYDHPQTDADASLRVNATEDDSILSSSPAQEPVVVDWNNETETLSVFTREDADSTSADLETEQRPVTYDWVGSIDEVRFVDVIPTIDDINSYLDQPVRPLANNEDQQTARYMFDERTGTTTEPIYSDTEAELVGGSFAEVGVEGPGLERGVDYELAFAPFTITALDGGELDGAPVVILTWGGGFGALIDSIVGVLPVLLFLIPLVVLVSRVQEEL